MKIIFVIGFFFLAQYCFGQNELGCEAIYELKIPYRPATLQILKDTSSLFPSYTANNLEKITYINVPAGHYKIRISGRGQPTQIVDSILVTEGQQLILNIKFYGPCLYDHPFGYIPVCPMNHKDNIIPIKYGLHGFVISKGDTLLNNKMDVKVKYAGCVVTDCDPQFYCKQHEIEF